VPNDKLWTIDQAAEHIGASTPVSARKTLSRWGVKAVDYQPVPGGGLRAVYNADHVRAAKASRPGRGARTDLYPLMALLDGTGHPARWNADKTTVTTACGQTGTPTATDDNLKPGEPYPYCSACQTDASKKEG
jgi:hypothetical protein